ncbi:MAG: hypothetical protein NTV89_19010 [Proteobacteria bacterium]|nr:hypothetical protein [Pseudomonadota bacterium]
MPMRLTFYAILLIVFVFTAGCATPVGVIKLDPKTVQRTLTANVLSNGNLSAFSAQILNRFGLLDEFNHHPAQVITKLYTGLPGVSASERLFTLAETSFLYAGRSSNRSYFLAAACAAYAFLFPQDQSIAPGCLDPRYRVAVDLYNRSIAEGLTAADGSEVILKAGVFKLLNSSLTLSINPAEFNWGNYRLVHFKQAAELGVRGLRNRYRWPGIGAPLAASIEPIAGVDNAAFSLVAPKIKVNFIRQRRPQQFPLKEIRCPLSLNKAQPWLTPLKVQTYINLNSRGCSPVIFHFPLKMLPASETICFSWHRICRTAYRWFWSMALHQARRAGPRCSTSSRTIAPCGGGISSGCLLTIQETLLFIPEAFWLRPCAVW